jgi:dinuclear metal center YbgI/SA1388 family protein
MITRAQLEKYLNKLLNIYEFSDYGPNGLQVEGTDEIKKIAFAVSATRESIEKAAALNADALIVHHGLFWKFHGVRTITKSFAKRVKPLIKNDINLLGYHLPLDAHIEHGNAAAIAEKLDLDKIKAFGDRKGAPLGVKGVFKNPIKAKELSGILSKILDHNIILASYDDSSEVKSIGIITGGANSDWTSARKDGLDAYLTGEISEHDWHEAIEDEIHYFAGGHNATEQFGVQKILKKIHEDFSDKNLELFFIPSNNPA